MKKIITNKFLFVFLIFCCQGQNPEAESDHYPITEIPIPSDIVLEVGGIEILPDEKIAVSSRRGDIYIVEGAYTDDPEDDEWTPWAIGLHEV
ncbi:MAG: hypothetical protein VX848_06300, partial [Verrucomicrobiota bacterium]|nr:hypothetical protein [Verrucomicrobiota bacterium]